MRTSIAILYAASIVGGVVSATCFITQNGFGGGHGDWDVVLWSLSLPWTLIRWPEAVQKSDFVRLTVLPFVLNMLIITLFRFLLNLRSRSASRD
jgi:hypothetical protein